MGAARCRSCRPAARPAPYRIESLISSVQLIPYFLVHVAKYCTWVAASALAVSCLDAASLLKHFSQASIRCLLHQKRLILVFEATWAMKQEGLMESERVPCSISANFILY